MAVCGQIVLDNSHFPVAGDQLILSTATDPTIDYATTGANYNWDFSNLTPTGQRFTDCHPMSQASALSSLLFGTFAPTAYKASYFSPTTDIPLDQLTSALPISIDEISQFSRSTTAALTLVGHEFVLSGQGIPAKSDTIETRYNFPLEYGDNWNSRGYTHLDMNPIYNAQWIQHRYRESEVDGWGTIATPFGTFNALRIHHRILETDSIYLSFDTLGTWIAIPVPETHEYEWRAQEEREAVLRIRTSVVLGTETVTAIEYRDEFNGLGLEDQSLAVSCYPNPVAEELIIESASLIGEILIRNQQGQIIQRVSGGATGIHADVHALASGIYYVEVKSTSGTQTHKFMKR